jgi:hypothetical protein
MIFDPFTIITALIPAFSDGIKRLIGKWTGGPTPQSVDELIKLQDADVRRLEALGQLDGTEGAVSKWVNNLRALQRPIVVFVVLATWVAMTIAQLYFPNTIQFNESLVYLVSNLASSVVFYLFGDRTYMYLKDVLTKK